MKACASLPGISVSPVSPDNRPVMLIDGVPAPDLIARRLDSSAPFDRRSGFFAFASSTVSKSLVDRVADRTVTLALPSRLVDGQVRWAVLVHGRLNGESQRASANTDLHEIEIKDNWGDVLDRPVAAAWWQTPGGLLFDDSRPALMMVGRSANRSERLWQVGGEDIYVFQESGLPWRVVDAIRTLSVLAGLGLSLHMIPSDLRDQSLSEQVDLRGTAGDALAGILQSYGLVIQRDLVREGNAVVERRGVRPIAKGRKVRVPWVDAKRPLGEALSIISEQPLQRAQQWVARADGWLVESTFELVHGWDPALENGPDSAYDRENNPEFSTYANVYRLWVLNEDGHFSGSPYNQGGAFDLTTFFGAGTVRPGPLRLLPTVTLDDAGVGHDPFVEVSLDGGVGWSSYPGSVKIRSDRVAVYINDATLPASFLSAAQSGLARIRVTASLQSPVPVRATRWLGNPFLGVEQERAFDLRPLFRFRRVAATSIHFSDVVSGGLVADQADDTGAMNAWLIRRMHQEDRGNKVGRARLSLAGAWPLLRIGDRLVDAGGSGIDVSGDAQAIVSRDAVVDSVRCQWSDGRESDGRTRSAGSGRAPYTTVGLRF
jgi:hypothetical protein